LAIATLADDQTLICSDELNHASIIDACRLSRADVRVFRHNDTSSLEAILTSSRARRRMVITEGVFSMDGDMARLDEIGKLCREHDAILVVDDAHGDFIYGRSHRGTAEYMGADECVDILISSMSKALGCFGGYIASSSEIVEYLINRSRTFIYTSALPALFARAALKALEMVEHGICTVDGRRVHLQDRLIENTAMLRNALHRYGFDLKGSTHIVPVMVGDERLALEFADMLLEHGVFAQAIRYPTVARGAARIRVSVTALHDRDTLRHVADVFSIVGKRLNLI
ncbi:MAG: aminotransferase class I/II-fold pyridoxal phosphate-dependent enzyme, partial [Candidatus Nitrosocaldus sp.]|nr:aminotransferase class I/II-fold pyridoxal phosphate-dependent enzyme [Candidatus Nitrosocaldus sp.]